MTREEEPTTRALTQLTELLRDAPARPSQPEMEQGLAALRARLAAPSPRRVTRPLVAAAVVLCAALALTATFLGGRAWSTHEKAIAVARVEGGQLLQGGYLSESGAEGVRLFFDEGSECALTPGGRGRLRVERATVRLLLERGAASLRITPTKEPRWSVESGPFLVTVKGTDFTVGWDPTSERFELTLRRGRVVVTGPLLGDDFVVRPGQKLSVSLPKAETIITEERPPVASASVAPLPSPTADLPVTAGSAEPSRPSDSAPAPSPSLVGGAPRQWRAALANGEWDRILAEAEGAGVESTLERASSDDLFALADAARYRRRTALAESALLAQRRRFPSSPRAAEAVFLLGRVAELRPSGRALALDRYDDYLARSPSGTYAAEALGRKMTLVKELRGAVKARPVAQAYLRQFPDGSYAGAAKTLLSVGE
jgi:ferric-dicitrate binding protein FerR (iron transport regulator)